MSSLHFHMRKRRITKFASFFYHNDGIHSFTLLNHSCCSFFLFCSSSCLFFSSSFLRFSSSIVCNCFYSPPQILTTIGTLFGLGLHLLFHDIPEHRRCNLTTTWNIMLAICFVISYPNCTY